MTYELRITFKKHNLWGMPFFLNERTVYIPAGMLEMSMLSAGVKVLMMLPSRVSIPMMSFEELIVNILFI